MPKKAPEEPKPLSFVTPNPWSALPREVYVGKGRGKKEGATTESPVDGQDQPRIYTIRDHTIEVLMHPDVLELHAVRVAHTPQGDERQLHLKVRVRCGQEELVVDDLVDTGAQVSLVRRGLFKEESLLPSRRPVRLKMANGEIIGGGTHEATISMESWEHERLNRLDLAKRSTLSGNFYVADITDWDMIIGYDFMVGNAIGALPHCATLVREDEEYLTWLSTDYTCGSSQWNAEEEDRIAQAVQAVGAKSRGDRGVQLTEYGMAPQVYARMIQMLGAGAPETDVSASQDAPLLSNCRTHWHRGDSAWHRHWGLEFPSEFFGIFGIFFLEFFWNFFENFFSAIFFLEFFGMSFDLVLARKFSEGVPDQKISGGHQLLHTQLTCKRPQTKPKNETGFGPTLGPHQSEGEITKVIHKDILYLTSVRVSQMQTSVNLLACSIWCIIHLVH